MKDLDAVEHLVELRLRDVQPDAPHHPQHARLRGVGWCQTHAPDLNGISLRKRDGIICRPFCRRHRWNIKRFLWIRQRAVEPHAPHHPQHARLRSVGWCQTHAPGFNGIV